MSARVYLHGPARYRLRSAAALCQSLAEASLARLFKRPEVCGGNWFTQVATRVMKKQLAIAFQMRDVNEMRRYLDSFFIAGRFPPMTLRDTVRPQFRGTWFIPDGANTRIALFYLHGGGYSFYPRGYSHFIAQIAQTARARTFALDYRLAPEHRFPAQLEDAVAAYRWLLENGTDSRRLVVAGDSAGANLTLGLLLSLRDTGVPMPGLAVLLSPPTGSAGLSAPGADGHCDWITEEMLKAWVQWFCDPTQLQDPLVSPVRADLHGLPPIYVQAGAAEILFGGIQAFVERAGSQGADIVLDSWEGMTHVFQIFAPYVPQSAEALRRISEVIDQKIG